MFGTVTLALFLLLLNAWKQASVGLRMMREPVATCELLADQLNYQSDLGVSALPYHSFRQLIRFREAWLLEVTQGRYITLPVRDLDDEFKLELQERLKQAGVRLD